MAGRGVGGGEAGKQGISLPAAAALRVRVAGHGVRLEWFCIRTGMRQGCPHSPLMFINSCLAREVIEACKAKGVLVQFQGGLSSVSAARS